MDRNLALEFIRVTEAGAIAAAKWIGKGDKNAADQASVDEMRDRFNQIDFKAKIVIGEGEKDEAPQLYVGETVGKGSGPEFDIAIDPLEGTNSVAYGRPNSLTVIVTGPAGTLLSAPDTYMDKIAVGHEAAQVIDLDAPVKVNIEKTAKALGKEVSELVVVVLERDRHNDLINEIRATCARAQLIPDGDVEPAIATCLAERGVDMLMGIGASTEGVLAAAPVKILGGQFMGRFKPRNDKDEAKLKELGLGDLNRIYTAEDLAKGNILTFTATGVTEGSLLDGVRFESDRIVTYSLVIRGTSKTVRYVKTHHRIETSS